jgi:histidine decarboxylase
MTGSHRRHEGENVRRILNNARSPYDYYCEGFGNNDSKGCYITTPVIAAGKTKIQGSSRRSLVLEQIQAFDTAEAEGAYIGQINLFQISSFCGLNGLIWGHDMVKCSCRPISYTGIAYTLWSIPVYDIDELLMCTTRLFGTARERRFPIIPGSLVPAAYKSISEIGPITLYGGLAIGIPRNSGLSAALFMEYVGTTEGESSDEDIEAEKGRILDELVGSVIEVGSNHDIDFEMIYVGTRALKVEEARLGCILVAVPYVTLAQRAVYRQLLDGVEKIDIDEWEAEVSHLFYHRVVAG